MALSLNKKTNRMGCIKPKLHFIIFGLNPCINLYFFTVPNKKSIFISLKYLLTILSEPE